MFNVVIKVLEPSIGNNQLQSYGTGHLERKWISVAKTSVNNFKTDMRDSRTLSFRKLFKSLNSISC